METVMRINPMLIGALCFLAANAAIHKYWPSRYDGLDEVRPEQIQRLMEPSASPAVSSEELRKRIFGPGH
jgi:hypothetical protein